MLHARPDNRASEKLDYWRLPPVDEVRIDTEDPTEPSLADFRLLADNLPVLCWIARGDGHIYWYNRRWHDYCGSEPKAMEGWGWQSVHDPEQLPAVMENWTRSVRSGEPFEMTFPLRGADGIYRTFLTRIVPVKDSTGRAVRWLGTNTEIEGQIGAEAALIASEAKLHVLTDTMPQMVWSTLPDGHHDYYNARWYEFTGVPYGSTDGEGWNDMFHPDDRERAWEQWRHSLQTGEPYEIEYRLRHASGEYRWTLGRALPVRDADGTITRWIGTCTDIHDSKRIAEQNEIIGRELSHRIKNIFAVISGLIGLSSPKDSAVKGFAQKLAGRISALGRAHNFARPHSPMSDIGQSFGSLHGLLAELLEPYAIDGQLRSEIAGEDVAVTDRSATPLALVVHELATNAVKYGALSAPDGKILIRTRRDGDHVIMSWVEKGGPEIETPPDQSGFGTQLSDISIADQLGGTIERDWARPGLQVTITVKAAYL